ncbi:MAG: hypothetical protein Q7U91_13465 [Sideroxyarcus sp.]|nr:hypothetical protein [Sideroxyarcus sp.]
MKIIPVILIAMSVTTAHAAVPATQNESCEQIRAQITAQTGVLAMPDVALLRKVGANRECRFTLEEGFRAAWGDKPMPKRDRSEREDD